MKKFPIHATFKINLCLFTSFRFPCIEQNNQLRACGMHDKYDNIVNKIMDMDGLWIYIYIHM